MYRYNDGTYDTLSNLIRRESRTGSESKRSFWKRVF